MEIVVKGRNVEVPEHFRTHVAERLDRMERYDSKIIRVDVELSHEFNRRQSKTCQRVQITVAGRGPVIRSECSADSFYAALDGAAVKLENRLRRSADRRHDRQHARTHIGALVGATDAMPGDFSGLVPGPDNAADSEVDSADTGRWQDDHRDGVDNEPGRIVRIKDHPADPITVDQALFQMELVGHDFYLFKDADTGVCSVVYRRKGFNYGLLRLAD